MPVNLDVKARLDRESTEKVAEEISARVKAAVHLGVREALREILGTPPVGFLGDFEK